MEQGPSINERETKQTFEDEKLGQINKVASLIMLERQGELTPNNINTLFTVTTGSLLKHGLVSLGRTYQETDTGYKVTDLSISAFEAQERVLRKLGVDEMGDWGVKFDTQPELVDYLNELSNEFQEELIQVLDDKEMIHG